MQYFHTVVGVIVTDGRRGCNQHFANQGVMILMLPHILLRRRRRVLFTDLKEVTIAREILRRRCCGHAIVIGVVRREGRRLHRGGHDDGGWIGRRHRGASRGHRSLASRAGARRGRRFFCRGLTLGSPPASSLLSRRGGGGVFPR